jgi:hypothetical protein
MAPSTLSSLALALVGGLLFVPFPALAEPATAPRRTGGLGLGVGLEPLALGTVEVVSRGHGAAGLGVAAALQIDLGVRWALRLPLSIDAAFARGQSELIEVAFTPGAIYRFRTGLDEGLVPYAGGGLRLAGAGAERDLLGLPVVTQSALELKHEHHGDHHPFGHRSDDPNFDTEASLGPEIWLGVEQRLSRWFLFDWRLSYSWLRVDGVGVHLFMQSLAARLTL